MAHEPKSTFVLVLREMNLFETVLNQVPYIDGIFVYKGMIEKTL